MQIGPVQYITGDPLWLSYTFIGDNLVNWQSKKLSQVVRSSADAINTGLWPMEFTSFYGLRLN